MFHRLPVHVKLFGWYQQFQYRDTKGPTQYEYMMIFIVLSKFQSTFTEDVVRFKSNQLHSLVLNNFGFLSEM